MSLSKRSLAWLSPTLFRNTCTIFIGLMYIRYKRDTFSFFVNLFTGLTSLLSFNVIYFKLWSSINVFCFLHNPIHLRKDLISFRIFSSKKNTIKCSPCFFKSLVYNKLSKTRQTLSWQCVTLIRQIGPNVSVCLPKLLFWFMSGIYLCIICLHKPVHNSFPW